MSVYICMYILYGHAGFISPTVVMFLMIPLPPPRWLALCILYMYVCV